MFVYLGDGRYKKLSSIIGIFDMDSATVCAASRRFLSRCEKEGRVESDGELPKSFLLCDEGEYRGISAPKRKKCATRQKNGDCVVLSKLASGVLLTRTARVKDDLIEEEI